MIYYYPYLSDKPNKKFFIITKDNKRVYFGDTRYQHFTEGHLDDERKLRYIKRHQDKEEKNWNKSGINTASFWSRFLLWNKPTLEASYKDIQKRFFN